MNLGSHTKTWMEELDAELLQARLNKKSLLQSITLHTEKISIIKRELADQMSKYDAEMVALRRRQSATKDDLKLRISNVRKSQIDDCMELKTVERSIEFTKELQHLRNRVDLRTLPAEILRNILKYLLVKDVCIPARNIWSWRQKYNIAVFCTCKMLQVEAYEIFYGYNTFAIEHSLHNLKNFSKFLRHIKVKIDSQTKILEFLKAIECSEQLQSLFIEIEEVPTYRESHNPSTLRLLKFQKPQSLQRIDVVCTGTLANVEDARTILEAVIKNGRCRSRDQGHTSRARTKGQRRSQRLIS